MLKYQGIPILPAACFRSDSGELVVNSLLCTEQGIHREFAANDIDVSWENNMSSLLIFASPDIQRLRDNQK
jgi:hypothetical protein